MVTRNTRHEGRSVLVHLVIIELSRVCHSDRVTGQDDMRKGEEYKKGVVGLF